MLDRLLPPSVDNTFRGHWLATWLLGVLVFARTAMGLNTIFNGRSVAVSADGIPLDSYAPAAARTVLSLFAVWGQAQVAFGLLGLVVLLRYRGLIPFVFALLLFEHLGRRLILAMLPIERTGSPPGFAVNVVLVALTVAGLALSLWERGAGRR